MIPFAVSGFVTKLTVARWITGTSAFSHPMHPADRIAMVCEYTSSDEAVAATPVGEYVLVVVWFSGCETLLSDCSTISDEVRR